MRPHLFAAVMLLVVLLFSTAIIAQSPAQDADATVGPTLYPEDVNPLTGLTVDDPAVLNRRPLIIKISNYPPLVRPQTGLNSADIVWEHLLAGGITRFSAVFYANNLPVVGPVRSARLIDFELVRIYRGLSAYSGMSQGTINILRTDALMSSRAIGDGGCPAYCRIPKEGLALEHTLYGNTDALRDLAATWERDTEPEFVYGMAFNPQPNATSTPAESISVQYSETDITWRYDAASGNWLRFQDGEPHMDALSDSQVAAANVVVIEEEHTIQPFVSENYWGPENFAFSVNFIGDGRIYLFRDGEYTEGVWRRGDREDPLEYYDLNGDVLPFKPGNTFFILVPRWIDGYQLVFGLPDAPSATVNGDEREGASMRKGPGNAYISPDVAYPGDRFAAIGRNKAGDWVQLQREGNPIIWLPVARLDLTKAQIAALPIVRPTVER
ncbi:MAG: DUF3048 domain-containing protein [Armatimonadetes bacterium]|nr:DUF3048 domain-containing protein [Anaerolineae bacterium]